MHQPNPFRKCRATGCFRNARADSPYCEADYRKVILDAIDYGKSQSPDYTAALDPKDGGHNER